LVEEEHSRIEGQEIGDPCDPIPTYGGHMLLGPMVVYVISNWENIFRPV